MANEPNPQTTTLCAEAWGEDRSSCKRSPCECADNSKFWKEHRAAIDAKIVRDDQDRMLDSVGV